MGASQSHEGDLSRDLGWTGRVCPDSQANSGYGAPGSHQRRTGKQNKNKGKPNPPPRVKILDTTHNSVTLSWQPPRHEDGHNIIAYTVEVAAVGPGRERQWKTVTASCQGVTYEARHLEANTNYMFRVRSENVYGVGKASLPSDVATTRMFETPATSTRALGDGFFQHGLDSTDHNFRRYRSFNMHLEGGVKSLLNHSDIIVNASSLSSPSSSSCSSERPGKPQILLRNNISRTSLPHNRKISAPIFLPGTRNSSLTRARESRSTLRCCSPNSEHRASSRSSASSRLSQALRACDLGTSDTNLSTHSTESCKKKILDPQKDSSSGHSIEILRDNIKSCDPQKVSCDHDATDRPGSGHTDNVTDLKSATVYKNNEKNKNNVNNVFNEKIDDNADDIYRLKEELKKAELKDEKSKVLEQKDVVDKINDVGFCGRKEQRRYYESLDNPWEQDMSLVGVSEQILAAPFSDDVKLALYAKNLSEEKSFRRDCVDHSSGHATDFRALRNVLHSDSIIVKTARSLPDVVAVAAGRESATGGGQLTTILDADEDDAVRVTTL